MGLLFGMFALPEGGVRDAPEVAGVILEGADMAPVHLVGSRAEVVLAER